MEKLKIGSNTFDLVPMGISEDTIRKTRSFTVAENMEFEEIRAAVRIGLSQIDHIGNDGNVSNSYMDCISLKSILVNEEGTYTITLSTDANLREIKDLKSQIDAVNIALANVLGV
jgi:hypothetical protein